MTSRAISISNTRIWKNSLSPEARSILWVVIVSVAVLVPAVIFGIPSNRDLSNHFRFALPFYDSIRSGHLYPGWLADSNSGYGDASFRFYSPATYYLLALTRTVTGGWYGGSLMAFALLFATGSLGIYLWAREFVPAQSAMWAGILYAVAPYHLNQIYQAFLLAEFAGAAVLPFVFAFAERVCSRRRPLDVAGFATSYALLILTHLPLAVIGSLALLTYVLLRMESEDRWKPLSYIGLSAALGLVASACYWTTMISELSWIRADNINPDPSVDYRRNFVLSTLSPDNLNVWWMNILLLATAAIFWPCFVVIRRSSLKAPPKVKALRLLLLGSVFMATPLSRPIWSLIHPLQETQFPWRWLAVVSVVCPIVFALAIPWWTRLWRDKKRPLVFVAAGTMAISLAFSASHIIREAQFLNAEEFAQVLRSIPGSPGVSQWWPVWVTEPLTEMKSPVDSGQRKVSVRSWEPEKRVFAVAAGNATEARVRTFYYPHWMATSGEQTLPVRPDTDGALLISIPANEVSVVLEFREPSRVRWAAAATALGWIAIVILASTSPKTRIMQRLFP